MTLLYIDGFDHYQSVNNTNMPQANVSGNYLYSSISFTYFTAGLTGGCARTSASSASSVGPAWVAPATLATFGVGCHVNIPALTHPVSIFQSRTAANGAIISLTLNTNRTLTLNTSDANGATLATSGTLIDPDEWTHVEMRLFHNTTTGTCEVRLNGQTVINFTGNTGAGPMGRLCFGSGGSSSGATRVVNYDNLFIWDTAGSLNNTFLGERNVYTLLPNADTAEADWTLSTGVSGFALIDNVPTTADYIESATLSDLSEFDLSALPSTDITIIGVQVSAFAQKTGTSDTEIEVGVVSNGVPASSASQALTQSEFRYFKGIFETNPDTLADWDPLDVNALVVSLERSL